MPNLLFAALHAFQYHWDGVVGVFAIGYGAARITCEFFREPDVQLGFVALNWLTMGQLLSLVMIAFGIVLIVLSRRKSA